MKTVDEPILKFSARWFSLPPFVAVLTITAANFLSTDLSTLVDPAIWGLVVLLFVVLTILYGLFIQQDFSRGFLPVQAIAQGLLLCPLSLNLGSRLQWLGVTMVICGSAGLVVMYYQIRALSYSAVFTSSLELSALPVPCAITDQEGKIVSASNVFLQLLQKPYAVAQGEDIASFLPAGEDKLEIDGKEWRILQTSMEGGLSCFQLKEAHDPVFVLPPQAERDENFIDPSTSLYTRNYAKTRINEELYRVRRYQRHLSAVSLRMLFQGNNPSAKEDEIFGAYCRFVRSNIREIDLACVLDSLEILAVMPETLLNEAEDAASKLSDFIPHLQESLSGFEGAVEIKSAVVFADASFGEFNFDGLLEKLGNNGQTTAN